MKSLPEGSRKVSCREILEADHSAVADLLARGFQGHAAAHWRRGLERQKARDLPADVPRYGYLLETDGRVVGTLLVIYSVIPSTMGEHHLRCNLSSWFVDPAFRSYATLLTSIAQKNRSVTFINLTPAPNTWPIVEAQGFRAAGTGLFFACLALSPGARIPIDVVEPGTSEIEALPAADLERLRHHAALGCLSLICRTADGPVPFILNPFSIRKGRVPLPAMQLIYAPSLDDVRRCAGALGRYLLPRGRLFVVMNADGPIAGLRGIFTTRRGRRYVRGPHPPSLCDLTDSEIVVFGR